MKPGIICFVEGWANCGLKYGVYLQEPESAHRVKQKLRAVQRCIAAQTVRYAGIANNSTVLQTFFNTTKVDFYMKTR